MSTIHGWVLEDMRRAAAERAYEEAEFACPVEAQNGWESDGGDDLWRTVFLDTGEEATRKTVFRVWFAPGTAETVGAPEYENPEPLEPEADNQAGPTT